MKIKICGITTVDAAKALDDYGADYIGFVFAKSSRQVTADQASHIAKHLSTRIKKVGVFVNESVDTMEDIAQTVGLDYIQLHGDEPASVAEELSLPVIRAFSIDELDDDKLNYPCEFFLIDSPGEKYRGGSGKAFNWERLNDIKLTNQRIFLAGGLSPDTIQNAIETVRPAGVDVSSGVETKGKKDTKKIKDFIDNVRAMSHLKG